MLQLLHGDLVGVLYFLAGTVLALPVAYLLMRWLLSPHRRWNQW
jgi:uncharacterized membrane protein YdjX (TVP38/TMEM64 family)